MNITKFHSSKLFWRPFSVLVVLCLLLLWGVACSPQPVSPTPPPTPPPAPSEPPTQAPPVPPTSQPVAWSADGTISPGEYTGVNTYGDYDVNWKSDDKYIYVGLKVKTSGWVAVGIQPGVMMNKADIILGDVSDDKVAVYDQYSTGNFGPHQSDEQLGGTNDILESGGKEADGYTTIEFKRALDTGDKYDHPLVTGVNKIIWAYGSDDQVTVRHFNRGYGEIDL